MERSVSSPRFDVIVSQIQVAVHRQLLWIETWEYIHMNFDPCIYTNRRIYTNFMVQILEMLRCGDVEKRGVPTGLGRGVDGEMGDVSGGNGRRRANTSLDKGVMVAGHRRGGGSGV